MVNYYPIEYWVLIPKIIEVIVFVILGMKINKAQKYAVNRIYCTAFLSWAAFTLTDCIIWITGANSDLWFSVANILRDFQMGLGIIVGYLIFLSSQVIIHGTLGVKDNPKFVIIVFIICIIIAILLILYDGLSITDLQGNLLDSSEWETVEYVRVSTNINLISTVLFIFPLVLYGHAIFILAGLAKKQENKEKKTKMNYLIFGNSLLAIGMIYFIIVLGIGWQDMISITIGHVIWSLSPVFIWMSKIQEKKE